MPDDVVIILRHRLPMNEAKRVFLQQLINGLKRRYRNYFNVVRIDWQIPPIRAYFVLFTHSHGFATGRIHVTKRTIRVEASIPDGLVDGWPDFRTATKAKWRQIVDNLRQPRSQVQTTR